MDQVARNVDHCVDDEVAQDFTWTRVPFKRRAKNPLGSEHRFARPNRCSNRDEENRAFFLYHVQ
jgi:hypothetical protein